MKKVLITGAGSYVGENVKSYIERTAGDLFQIESVDTFGDNWKKADYSQFDVVYHVAGWAASSCNPSIRCLPTPITFPRCPATTSTTRWSPSKNPFAESN